LKAIKVSESLNFERGKDPKESMGIGKLVKYKKLYKELLKDSPAWFSYKILDLGITNEIPIDKVHYVLPDFIKIFKKFFANNTDFEFIDAKTYTTTGAILFIKERNNIEESFNFDRNDNDFDNLRIGRKQIELKFEDLQIGESYLTTIMGSFPGEEDYKEKMIILDKDEEGVLVCEFSQLYRIKYLAEKNKVELTLEFMSEVGIEDSELDEILYVYDRVNDHIETVMGYHVKFNYLK
jgi:hypothetical protein